MWKPIPHLMQQHETPKNGVFYNYIVHKLIKTKHGPKTIKWRTQQLTDLESDDLKGPSQPHAPLFLFAY